MSQPQLPPQPEPRQRRSLYKQMSWSPDVEREEVWLRRKSNYHSRRNKSVTDDDLEELKGCFELGFGFGKEDDVDPKLLDTLPALGFYCAVNKQYSNSLSRSSSSSSILSDTDSTATISSSSSSSSIVDPGDCPELVKVKLKQWAMMVACSVRQNSGKSN